jgi:ankyrin repeat protein
MAPTTLRAAVDQGDVDGAAELLRTDPCLATALISAPDIEPTSPLTYVGMARFYGYARHNRTGELATALVEAGADKDDEAKNGSPLICAASHGDVEVVRALLRAGADVELCRSPGETALRLAAAYGWPEIVDILIDAGATVQSSIEAAGAGLLKEDQIAAMSPFDKACALRAAAVNERLEVIDRLLAHGTPMDAEVDGRPAIYWAQRQGRQRAVAYLVSRGARKPQVT